MEILHIFPGLFRHTCFSCFKPNNYALTFLMSINVISVCNCASHTLSKCILNACMHQAHVMHVLNFYCMLTYVLYSSNNVQYILCYIEWVYMCVCGVCVCAIYSRWVWHVFQMSVARVPDGCGTYSRDGCGTYFR